MQRVAALLWAMAMIMAATTDETDAQPSRERFRIRGETDTEQHPSDDARGGGQPTRRITEAPTGFDNETNGFLPQGPPFDTINEDNVVPLRSFNDNRFIFEEVEVVADGLGPIYNAQSCGECHQNVVTGGASQIAEHRTGRLMGDEFFESLGGSLVHSRATHPDIVEPVDYEDSIRTFRISTNTLGAGYIEAIANATLMRIREQQPVELRGSIALAPVLEAAGRPRVGRFGWKNQHSSLVSFAADAYLNEMGITSPLFPTENTSSGRDVSEYDPVPDPEDDGVDIDAFADFMRATKAPSRGEINADVLAGETIFNSVGCATCHVPTLVTAPAGTRINGGKLVVHEALGNKSIHAYSDFLMHDIGTGDGIPVQPTPEFASTATQIRTAPLWALRTRNRLMHDGLTFTEREAIERHAGQAASVTARFKALSAADQALLLQFLSSL